MTEAKELEKKACEVRKFILDLLSIKDATYLLSLFSKGDSFEQTIKIDKKESVHEEIRQALMKILISYMKKLEKERESIEI